MNIVIDHGNTAAKVGIFDHQTLLEHASFASLDALRRFLSDHPGKQGIVCSVGGKGDELEGWLNTGRKFQLKHNLPVPVESTYATPETLGMDRLAGVCGAQAIFPRENCLVIDAGTCITFDFIDDRQNYFGGSIHPGLHMRLKAMHTFTAKLPLVPAKNGISLIGNSTETCLQSGALIGMASEIDGMIERYAQKFGPVRAILTGGDAPFFENQLKASIFASPELVLIGLNSILNHNVNR